MFNAIKKGENIHPFPPTGDKYIVPLGVKAPDS